MCVSFFINIDAALPCLFRCAPPLTNTGQIVTAVPVRLQNGRENTATYLHVNGVNNGQHNSDQPPLCSPPPPPSENGYDRSDYVNSISIKSPPQLHNTAFVRHCHGQRNNGTIPISVPRPNTADHVNGNNPLLNGYTGRTHNHKDYENETNRLNNYYNHLNGVSSKNGSYANNTTISIKSQKSISNNLLNNNNNNNSHHIDNNIQAYQSPPSVTPLNGELSNDTPHVQALINGNVTSNNGSYSTSLTSNSITNGCATNGIGNGVVNGSYLPYGSNLSNGNGMTNGQSLSSVTSSLKLNNLTNGILLTNGNNLTNSCNGMTNGNGTTNGHSLTHCSATDSNEMLDLLEGEYALSLLLFSFVWFSLDRRLLFHSIVTY